MICANNVFSVELKILWYARKANKECEEIHNIFFCLGRQLCGWY